MKNIICSFCRAFKDRKSDVAAIATIIIFYLFLEGLGITCPILFLTGISCAGCGMSRAWLSVLRLDFSSAFSFHPLFWILIPVLVLFLLRKHISTKLCHMVGMAIILLFLLVYLLRMMNPNDVIVVFRPEEGIVFRVLESLSMRGFLRPSSLCVI
ncbi:MAG: DUF2752 domain-containing protein [Clostridiales bacterium]|nr:DUF2752 domain-containing protein [Clostridiales bacterium]